MKIPETKDMEIIKSFINDSLYVVDMPQIIDLKKEIDELKDIIKDIKK